MLQIVQEVRAANSVQAEEVIRRLAHNLADVREGSQRLEDFDKLIEAAYKLDTLLTLGNQIVSPLNDGYVLLKLQHARRIMRYVEQLRIQKNEWVDALEDAKKSE